MGPCGTALPLAALLLGDGGGRRSGLAGGAGGGRGAGLRGRGGGAALLVPLLRAALREADHRLDLPASGRRGAGADLPLPVGGVPGPGGHLPRPSLLGGRCGPARRLHRHRQPDPGGQRDVQLLGEEPPRRGAQPPANAAERQPARGRLLLPADGGRPAGPAGLPPCRPGRGSAPRPDGPPLRGAQRREAAEEAAGRPEGLHRSGRRTRAAGLRGEAGHRMFAVPGYR